MEPNENTMKVIAIGVQRPKEDCRVIQKIAGDIAVSFETMAELCFEDDEDDNIIEMVKDMYADGDYENAAMLLRLSFSIAKMYDEADIQPDQSHRHDTAGIRNSAGRSVI
jgi:predicted nuclease of restriction endonuclease-like RecB superfamily